jgi:hypothetical protein
MLVHSVVLPRAVTPFAKIGVEAFAVNVYVVIVWPAPVANDVPLEITVEQPPSLYSVTAAASVVVRVKAGVRVVPGDDGDMETYANVGGVVSTTIDF